MGIIRKKLGNVPEIIKKKFQEHFSDGFGGIRYDAFCAGWREGFAEAKEALRLLRKEFVELAAEKQRLEAENRWIPTVNPPDNIDWDKKVLALEHESEIPKIMTMAEIFLDEGSEVEYWKPIILPDQAQKEAKE